MHNYLLTPKATFDYYDLCVFHSNDIDISQAFIKSEMRKQISG